MTGNAISGKCCGTEPGQAHSYHYSVVAGLQDIQLTNITQLHTTYNFLPILGYRTAGSDLAVPDKMNNFTRSLLHSLPISLLG